MNTHTAALVPNYNLEPIARYANLCRVAIEFYIATGNPTELDYAGSGRLGRCRRPSSLSALDLLG